MRDLWRELHDLTDAIFRSIHQVHGWEKTNALVFQRGQLINVLADFIARKHVPPPTNEQKQFLIESHQEIVSKIEATLRQLKQSMEASQAYEASKS